MEPKTQKAKGISLLAAAPFMFNKEIESLPYYLVQDEQQFDPAFMPLPSFPRFARFCPIRPRHGGGVDSRVVNTRTEALNYFRECKKADPEAEVILMPFIEADYSVIWTKGKLSIGPSNDGATAGHESLSIATGPVMPIAASNVEGVLVAADIKAPEVPYLEMVFKGEKKYVVQMRAGPDISSFGDDYVPKKMKVTKIVTATGNLEEWEVTAARLKGRPGVVVWHPGGNMTSHYAVQSVTNGVAILTTKKPKVGDVLQKTEMQKPVRDIDEVLKGLSLGVELDVPFKEAALVVLGSLHNVLFLSGRQSRLLGVGVALALKLSMAACFGEARHRGNPEGLARDQIYHKAWADLRSYVQRFNEARAKFYAGGWRGGFGGPKWGACADAAARLWNAVVRFVRTKESSDLDAVVEALNNVINQAHNNGWWFNKFVSARWFDIAATYSAAPLIVTADIVYRVMKSSTPFGGLMADVEKVNAKQEGEPEGEAAAQGGGPKDYKGFHIVHDEKQEKPWLLENPETHEAVKSFADLRAVALFLNEAAGKPTEKRYVTATYAVLSRVIQGKRERSNGSGDAWMIPDLSAQDLKKAAPKKPKAVVKWVTITMGQATERPGKVLHIQARHSGDEQYLKFDVAMTPEVKAAYDVEVKKYPTKSWASGDKVYCALKLELDGLYLGETKVLGLEAGRVKQITFSN